MNPDPTVPPASGDPAGRLYELVSDALTLPPAKRTAFLHVACGSDTTLLAEALSLVGDGQRSSGFLDQPAYVLLAREASGELLADSLPPGEMLGEYRIISLLGEGSMGEVYLAQDTELKRSVAVKLLKRRLDDAGLARRFRHERRVLAALTHPNIARLYDGDMTPEGISYLVMEYVEGERLDRFCELKGLGVAERLKLFRKVCAAVAYAHQNLVVHRDLKPANVRVTPEGEPKLLDFGIAKLLDPEGTTAKLDPTMTMAGAMTPEYASPEQIKGEPITTASDVYSLGVVLYELLTGRRPFAHLKSRRPDERARAVCEEEPPRASTVATDAVPAASGSAPDPKALTRWRRQLKGDLDNIVAKALRKEPSRRYLNVTQLADDLRRYAEGQPVSACRDGFAYRAGKFVRRNKAAVTAAALAVLALATGLVVATVEARRANRRFEDVRRLAHSILFEMEPKIARLSGSMETRQLLVQRAREYLDSLSAEAGADSDLRREVAVAYRKVGDIQGNPSYSNLGDLKGALASYQKALGMLEGIVAANDHDWQARDELAKLHQQIGAAVWWADRKDEALRHRQASLVLRRRLVAEQPGSVDLRRELVDVLMDVGDWHEDCFQLSDALAAYDEALPIARAVAAAPPQVPEDRVNVARFLVRISKVRKDAADYPAAMDALAQAQVVVAPLAQQRPFDRSVQLENWYIAYNQLRTVETQKLTAQGLEYGARAVGLAQALVAANPGDTTVQHDLALSLDDDATVLRQAERWPEALAAARSEWDIDSRLAALSPETSIYTGDCIGARWAMGEAHRHLGDNARATEDVQAAQTMIEGELAKTPKDPDLRKTEVSVCELAGDLCEDQSEPAQARGWYKRGQETLQILTDEKQISDNEAPDFADQRAKFAAKLSTVQ